MSPRTSLLLNLVLGMALIVGGPIACVEMNKRHKLKWIEQLKEEELSGTIDSVFLDPEGRMQPVVLMNGSYRSQGYKVYIRNPIFHKMAKGDKLLKSKGTLIYFLVSGNDTTAFYQQDDGEDVKQ